MQQKEKHGSNETNESDESVEFDKARSRPTMYLMKAMGENNLLSLVNPGEANSFYNMKPMQPIPLTTNDTNHSLRQKG